MHDARGFAAELAVDHRSPWDKGGDLDLIQHVLRTFAEYADEALVNLPSGSAVLFDAATVVSHASRSVTLLPGDVIYTGTPGTTSAMKPGDTVEVEIDGIGILKNGVAA